MTLSSLQKTFISSLCVSGALFTIATAPLAIFRSQPIEVQMQNQSIFSSELNALTGPYLGVAGAFSLAIGSGILGINGWRLAATQSEVEKEKSSKLERSLSSYQAELERIKFSEARLKAQNLEDFLEPQPAPVAQLAATPASRFSSATVSEAPLVEPTAVAVSSDAISHDPKTLTMVPKIEGADLPSRSTQSAASENQIDLLLHQLQDLATQVEHLRANNSGKMAA
ncbi:hypothetical protein [Sphaerothrix gracilis]|uniref:hypothetical protein n=1 Tax=Sphaerothrix gracilis TaxID=3151835 RepID=UPI0031FCDB69